MMMFSMEVETVTQRKSVDGYFSELLGMDLARIHPGEIVTVRSIRRESPGDESSAGRTTTPVWILVAGGRGAVSSSRFLFRVVEAWAQDFAAPEYLLLPKFLDDLQAAVSRALDSPAAVVRSRLFAAVKGGSGGKRVVSFNLPLAEGKSPERALAESDPDRIVLFLCSDSDHASAHAALATGCIEYGRSVKFVVRR